MARIDNLSNYLADVASAIKEKKGDETPIPAKDFDTEIINLPSSGGVYPHNIKNVQAKIEPSAIGLKWEEPEDTKDHEGQPYCNWKGTKLVYREGDEIPLNEEDGTLALDNQERNAYKDQFYMIPELKTDQKYSFGLFPYSDKDVHNVNEVNCATLVPTVVSFSTATDEQIATILDAHYKGLLNISDYWHVGDTRVMHLNAMTGGSGGETHVAQNMTMVIIGINHDNLKEKVGTRTKAAVTLQCKEMLGNNGSYEAGQNYGGSGQWSANPRRTWLNSTFYGALPTGVQSLVKTVIKKNLANHSDNSAGNDTEDKVFFPSYPEMFGNVSYSYYMNNRTPNNEEGEQYPYYNSNERRKKFPNNNGVAGSSANYYWLRSPSSNSSSYWIRVTNDGTASDYDSTATYGIAPAFCL